MADNSNILTYNSDLQKPFINKLKLKPEIKQLNKPMITEIEAAAKKAEQKKHHRRLRWRESIQEEAEAEEDTQWVHVDGYPMAVSSVAASFCDEPLPSSVA